MLLRVCGKRATENSVKLRPGPIRERIGVGEPFDNVPARPEFVRQLELDPRRA